MANPLRRAAIQALVDQGYSRERARAIVEAESSPLVSALLGQLRALGVPEPDLEHRFCKEREWRLDLAWPAVWLCAEVDGATHKGGEGRHTSGRGYYLDAVKINQATLMGWRVLRYTVESIESGAAARQIAEALGVEATA